MGQLLHLHVVNKGRDPITGLLLLLLLHLVEVGAASHRAQLRRGHPRQLLGAALVGRLLCFPLGATERRLPADQTTKALDMKTKKETTCKDSKQIPDTYPPLRRSVKLGLSGTAALAPSPE